MATTSEQRYPPRDEVRDVIKSLVLLGMKEEIETVAQSVYAAHSAARRDWAKTERDETELRFWEDSLLEALTEAVKRRVRELESTERV